VADWPNSRDVHETSLFAPNFRLAPDQSRLRNARLAAMDGVQHSIERCPFLREVAEREGPSFAKHIACRPAVPYARSAGPVLEEDISDLAATFQLFHGESGVIPLRRACLPQGDCLLGQPVTNAPFVASKQATQLSHKPDHSLLYLRHCRLRLPLWHRSEISTACQQDLCHRCDSLRREVAAQRTAAPSAATPNGWHANGVFEPVLRPAGESTLFQTCLLRIQAPPFVHPSGAFSATHQRRLLRFGKIGACRQLQPGPMSGR